MRTLLFSALIGLAAVPASAQSFRLEDPVLSVDGRRVGVVGAPLAQEAFGAFTLVLPGTGTYRVSDRPFDGARGVGQFDGAGLYFAVDGRSVRLRSAGPILGRPGPATAFVRFDATPEPGARGLARVALAGVEAPGRSPAPSDRIAPVPRTPAAALPATDRAPLPGRRRESAERFAAAERDALSLQVAALQHERDELRARVGRLTADLDAERLTTGRLAVPPQTATPRGAVPDSDPDGPAPRRGGASLPDFDFARLQNPDVLQRRLDEVAVPAAGHRSGDVLVLFATDPDGNVIRTAISVPIGGGLDGLAESLVREMRFVPPVVGGMTTGIRSQVVVRFAL